MSDDERDEATGPVEEQEPEIDEKGFHIIRTGGKLQNQVSTNDPFYIVFLHLFLTNDTTTLLPIISSLG